MGLATAATVIEAPIFVVWEVMLDLDRYPEWNPFTVRISRTSDGPLQVGEQLVAHVRWNTGGRARATQHVTVVSPPADKQGRRGVLEYRYGGPLGGLGLVRGRRRQEVVRLEDHLTAYTTSERLHGPLAALAPLGRVQDGFQRHADALKARAEERWHG